MALVKVGRAGKVTLPAPIRRQLEIAEGDRLEAEVVEGGVLLRRSTGTARGGAWARIREAQRSVRYIGPEPRPDPEEEERMVHEEIEALRHKNA
jgi:AbrB family looped-hinge helix DNA binding protein